MTCDYHSLLEAMEQQRISVAKSGVVTSMSSRTTILAAANPAGGCYERRKSVQWRFVVKLWKLTFDGVGLREH
jgi:DNA helicase MCM8